MKRLGSGVLLALVASPLVLLIGGALLALVLATSPREVWRQAHEQAVYDALLLSLKTTLASLAIILTCGTGLALVMARAKPGAAASWETLVTLPAILPPSVAGLSLLLAFGHQGLFGSYMNRWGVSVSFTPVAVVMAQVFVATPFYVREASAAFRSLDVTICDAAKVDGANGMRLLWHISLPLLAPFLVSGAALAWARALGEFGATILFAGNLQGVTQTAPLAIYLGFESNLEQAKALAVILLFLAVFFLFWVRLSLRRRFSL